MQIRNATSADLSAVETLLSASDLPLDGVKDNFASFVVAEVEGEVTGAIGLEQFGSVALLRSAVVSAEHRGSGVGRRLVEQLLKHAEEFRGACPETAVVMKRRVETGARAPS